jgi:predicted protein tyrosine phosphatase
MEQIIRGLYLGSDDDVAEAKRRGYARLCACKDGPDSHRSMLGYTSLGAPKGKDYLVARKGDVMALNIIDSEDPSMIPDKVLDAGLAFIKEQMDKGNKILVHCNAGHSRSPSLVMLYLRSIGELPQGYNRALHIFKTLYPKYDPGHGMEYHVRTRW